jgi:cytochrome c oxidase subunit 4
MAQHKPTDHHDHHQHHVIPFAILTRVCFALLMLTALTVATSRMHLGMFAAPVAFLIALVKAMLVMAFFMGLKYDVKANRFIFATGFFFLAVLFFFCALDIYTRVFQGNTL